MCISIEWIQRKRAWESIYKKNPQELHHEKFSLQKQPLRKDAGKTKKFAKEFDKRMKMATSNVIKEMHE